MPIQCLEYFGVGCRYDDERHQEVEAKDEGEVGDGAGGAAEVAAQPQRRAVDLERPDLDVQQRHRQIAERRQAPDERRHLQCPRVRADDLGSQWEHDECQALQTDDHHRVESDACSRENTSVVMHYIVLVL